MNEKLIERSGIDAIIRSYKDKNIIKVFAGIRRAGKSYLLKLLHEQLLQENISEERIVYIDFEDFENEKFCDVHFLYQHIKNLSDKNNGERLYLLFDEIQEVPNWEKCVNSLYASESIDTDIYITGSNANLLSGELATYLSGRYVTIPVFPLSYKEFLCFYGKKDSSKSFSAFMRQGGFPGLHSLNQNDGDIKSYLDGIYSTVLLKDVIARNKIRETALLEKIILYISQNIGNIFSAKRVADFLKSSGRSAGIETVYNDISYLQNALFLYKVQRYDIKGKKILETMEKYYIADQGLRFNLLGFKDTDINGILENIVFIELLRHGFSVFIGKTENYEIDFVAEKSGQKEYFQVAYLLPTKETLEREVRPLKMIRDNFPKTILTLDNLPDSNQDGIARKNLRNWLLEEK